MDTKQLDIELTERLRGAGYGFNASDLNWDGSLHYVNGEEPFLFKGWYVARTRKVENNLIRFIIMSEWVKSEKLFFKASTKKLTKGDQEALTEAERVARTEAQAKKEALWVEKAQAAYREWDSLKLVKDASAYLERKGLYRLEKEVGHRQEVGSFLGARIIHEDRDVVLKIPMRDLEGRIWGLQTIASNGSKTFIDGQKISESCLIMGELNPKDVVYVSEGFSTGATVHLSTRKTVIVAFGAGNFDSLSCALRRRYPRLKIVLLPDNDTHKLGGDFRPLETGYKAARAACSRSASSLVLPSFPHSENPTATDWNDLYLLSDASEVSRQILAHRPIAPEEYILTEHTGFYEVKLVNGKPSLSPRVDHLADYYARENIYKTVTKSEVMWAWNGKKYVDVPRGTLYSLCLDKLREEPNKKSTTKYLANEFMFQAVHRVENQISVDWFYDTTAGKIAFQNGVFDTKTGSFGEHDSRCGVRSVLEYDYNPVATCPVFEKMLDLILGADEELKKALYEFIGYILSGDDCWAQKALLLSGGGSNGKSTLINVIKELIGSENSVPLQMSDLSSEYNRAKIDGKLAVLSEENNVNEKTLGQNEYFKNLVTGGTTIARSPYEKPFSFRNRAKFVFSFNNFNRMPELTHGFTRRLIIIPFNKKIEKTMEGYDPHIEKKLSLELSGIFNKAWEAYKEAVVRGHLFEPKASEKAVKKLTEDSDAVFQFLEEMLILKTENNAEAYQEMWITPKKTPDWLVRGPSQEKCFFTTSGELYAEYREWCQKNGHFAMAHNRFTARCKELCPAAEESRRVPCVTGVSQKRGLKWPIFD